MKKLNCEVTITLGETNKLLRFTALNSCEIKSSLNSLGSTAKLTLPRKIYYDKEPVDLKWGDYCIGRGDKISIKLGYDADLEEVFRGFVVRTSSDYPLMLDCEDYFFKLRNHTVAPFQYDESMDLNKFLNALNLGISHTATSDIKLGRIVSTESLNALKMLDLLQKKYSLFDIYFFMRKDNQNDKLYGVRKPWEWGKNHIFRLGGKNADIIKHTLTYNPEEIKVQIQATSILSNVDKKKVSTSQNDKDENVAEFKDDTPGLLQVFKVNSPITDEELKEFVEDKHKKLTRKNLTGEITIFGNPQVLIGDSITLVDELEYHNEREGTFLAESVTTTFGYDTGFRQTIKLGERLDN